MPKPQNASSTSRSNAIQTMTKPPSSPLRASAFSARVTRSSAHRYDPTAAQESAGWGSSRMIVCSAMTLLAPKKLVTKLWRTLR